MRFRLLPVVLLLVAATAYADIFEAKHSCYQPQKPPPYEKETIDSYRMKNFRYEVEQYQFCIENFIREQQKQIRNHQQAIDAAKEEWDIFAKRNLREEKRGAE